MLTELLDNAVKSSSQVPVAQVHAAALVETAQELIREQARPYVVHLLHLPAEGDLEAQAYWADCAERVGHLLGPAQSDLEAALENYEFVHATQLLAPLVDAAMGVPGAK